jgi:hypothetical protein
MLPTAQQARRKGSQTGGCGANREGRHPVSAVKSLFHRKVIAWFIITHSVSLPKESPCTIKCMLSCSQDIDETVSCSAQFQKTPAG